MLLFGTAVGRRRNYMVLLLTFVALGFAQYANTLVHLACGNDRTFNQILVRVLVYDNPKALLARNMVRVSVCATRVFAHYIQLLRELVRIASPQVSQAQT